MPGLTHTHRSVLIRRPAGATPRPATVRQEAGAHEAAMEVRIAAVADRTAAEAEAATAVALRMAVPSLANEDKINFQPARKGRLFF